MHTSPFNLRWWWRLKKNFPRSYQMMRCRLSLIFSLSISDVFPTKRNASFWGPATYIMAHWWIFSFLPVSNKTQTTQTSRPLQSVSITRHNSPGSRRLCNLRKAGRFVCVCFGAWCVPAWWGVTHETFLIQWYNHRNQSASSPGSSETPALLVIIRNLLISPIIYHLWHFNVCD